MHETLQMSCFRSSTVLSLSLVALERSLKTTHDWAKLVSERSELDLMIVGFTWEFNEEKGGTIMPVFYKKDIFGIIRRQIRRAGITTYFSPASNWEAAREAEIYSIL